MDTYSTVWMCGGVSPLRLLWDCLCKTRTDPSLSRIPQPLTGRVQKVSGSTRPLNKSHRCQEQDGLYEERSRGYMPVVWDDPTRKLMHSDKCSAVEC